MEGIQENLVDVAVASGKFCNFFLFFSTIVFVSREITSAGTREHLLWEETDVNY